MARQEQIVIQSRFGEQVVEKDKVIYFPRGIIGFENVHEFTLLRIHENTPMLILQSLDEPTLGLFVADVYSFMSKYVLKIGDAEQKMLCLDKIEDATILVTVSIPHGKPHLTSLNLTGPIVVNAAKRIGMQIPQADAKVTHALISELMAQKEENKNAEETNNTEKPAEEKTKNRRIYTS